MSAILSDLSDPAVTHAIDANEIERFAYYSQVPGGEIRFDPELTWYITGIPYLLFNGILDAHLPPDELDARITRALAPFEARGLPMFWMTGPSTQPADLGRHLIRRGFTGPVELVGMAADLSALNSDMPAPSALRIERVGDTATLERWTEAYSASFDYTPAVGRLFFDVFASLGLDARLPLCHYLGSLDGRPVATSSLFLGAGVAGLYSVGTIPAVRRQGIGAAMTLAALRDASTRGYRIGILHAEPPAVSLYRRLGFHERSRLHPYLWLPEHRGHEAL